MSKYIIELDDRIKLVTSVGVTENGVVYTTSDYVHNLEELNSDYTNEHFGELQQDAYDRGYKDGRNVTETQAHDDAYQRGLDDAWEAARKVGHCKLWDDYTKDTGKPSVCAVAVLDRYTAYEAIAKLKAYEEKQKADDKIEVGDEVEWDNDFTGDRFIVTRIYQPYGKKEQCDGIDDDGDVYRAVLIESLVKTGRHFDIASILEDMRND